MIAKELREQLFNLPADERRRLGEELLESLAPTEELSPELKAELDRRLADYEKNPSAGRPWKEVYARLKADLGK